MKARDLFVLIFVMTAATVAIYYYSIGHVHPAASTATAPDQAVPGTNTIDAPLVPEVAPGTKPASSERKSVARAMRGGDAPSAATDGQGDYDISGYFEKRLNARPSVQPENKEPIPIEDFADGEGQ